jgi:hypothetical protein
MEAAVNDFRRANKGAHSRLTYIRIDGSVPPEKRDNYVQDFQAEENCRVRGGQRRLECGVASNSTSRTMQRLHRGAVNVDGNCLLYEQERERATQCAAHAVSQVGATAALLLVQVAILQIKAAGVGLTLTAANTVVFAELPWTPAELVQAEDRAHRIGQHSSVNVKLVLLKDSIDEMMWDLLGSKVATMGKVLDGAEARMEVRALGLPAGGRR